MSITAEIDRTVASIPDATMAAGVAWFPRCRADLANAAREYGPAGVGQVRAAGIFAALSPRLQWKINWDAMVKVLAAARDGRKSAPKTGLVDARNKAWAIALGAKPEAVLRGPKVTRFYRALAGDDRPVTVDVWMMRAAGLDGSEAPTIRQYREIEAAVTLNALDLSIPPCGLQAAIWMHVRPPQPNDPWAVA